MKYLSLTLVAMIIGTAVAAPAPEAKLETRCSAGLYHSRAACQDACVGGTCAYGDLIAVCHC
ncbi:hypothetical protein BKA67DRAFT_694641 [Truncatella angustata]|uniref:Defensin n=1 Tax=Truncatella angustata TaxID=152316 RepID=A0A9P8UCL8_9PEZI|nr:uncharacterized protein BKA67DRAFT_694641 [Truncatella angustata]KAH6647614.1 hypothetical protein BKA67DRAFT_694641 [Truncatella angustata]